MLVPTNYFITRVPEGKKIDKNVTGMAYGSSFQLWTLLFQLRQYNVIFISMVVPVGTYVPFSRYYVVSNFLAFQSTQHHPRLLVASKSTIKIRHVSW